MQDSTVETERWGSQVRLQPSPIFVPAAVPLTEIPFNVATKTTLVFVFVLDTNNPIQLFLNIFQYSVQPNATQLQLKAANPNPVSLMAHILATSKPTSSFTVPVNCFAEFVHMEISNNKMSCAMCQQIPVSCIRPCKSTNCVYWQQRYSYTRGSRKNGGTVYHLNLSSGSTFIGGAIPISILVALMTVGGPEFKPTVSIATPRTESTAYTIKDSPQLLAETTIYPSGNWRKTTEILYKGTSVLACLKVLLTQLY